MIKENEVYAYKGLPIYEEIDEKIYRHMKQYVSIAFDIIKPSDKVVVKPNFVKECHMKKKGQWDSVITHPMVIRIVLEEVASRLGSGGEIYIVDAPQTDSDFKKIIKETQLSDIINHIQKKTKVKIKCFDLREEQWISRGGIIVRRKKLCGDPNGYVKVNLGDKSEFYGKKCKEYYGADYNMSETRKYHNESDNIYIMSKTVLMADVFINIPKMKTHKLAGVTISLKNLVGTCVVKNSIPHHTLGSPESGGDKFQTDDARNRSESKLKNMAINVLKLKNPVLNYPLVLVKKVAELFLGSTDSGRIRNGMWYGNDTIWRSVVDLNKVIFFADKEGVLRDTVQRKYISIVDGIVGGENNGPMEPDRKESGVLIIGVNPVAVDAFTATIMGFDYKKIPSIKNCFQAKGFRIFDYKQEDIVVHSNYKLWEKNLVEFVKKDTLSFVPHHGWLGHIELEK